MLSDQMSLTVQNSRPGSRKRCPKGRAWRQMSRACLQLSVRLRKTTRRNTSSMLQDVQKKKMTEIDSINGYIIQLARKHDIEVPVNEALYGLVKSMAGCVKDRN